MATYKLKPGVKNFRLPGTQYNISDGFLKDSKVAEEVYNKFQMVQRRVEKTEDKKPAPIQEPVATIEVVDEPVVYTSTPVRVKPTPKKKKRNRNKKR